MSSAYFQCIGGASGDMILGALLDAGLAIDDLRGALAKLNTSGYSLKSKRAQRGGLEGTHLVVDLEELGRKSHTIGEFVNIVEASGLSDSVVRQSRDIFLRIGEAEARVHGTKPGETHLHELGTLDTLVDVVGGVAGLEMLGVDKVYCSAFPSGSGVIRSAHGLLPVPAPATAAIFQIANAPVAAPPNNAHNTGEMVTPTGAAILTIHRHIRTSPIECQPHWVWTRHARFSAVPERTCALARQRTGCEIQRRRQDYRNKYR